MKEYGDSAILDTVHLADSVKMEAQNDGLKQC